MSTATALKNSLIRCTLEVTKGPHAGLKLDFEKATISIGRDLENDIALPKDPRVSRQHAEIKQDMGQFQVVNLSQRNFVLINGTRITTESIASGGTLQVGETEFKFFVHDQTDALEPAAPSEATTPSAEAAAPAAPPSALVKNNVTPITRGPQAPAPRMSQAPASSWGHPPAVEMPPPFAPPPAAKSGLLANPRVRLYGGIVLFILLGLLIMKGGRTQRAVEKPFRTTEELDAERQESENEIKAFKERQTKMQATVYQKAYENFLRGYRDYRLGQYSRALDAFQVVLNLDPGNELAVRYYNLAKIRFDELVKFNLLQGQRYLDKQNYRMCKSSFQNVMTMLAGNTSSPEYVEAKQLHERCTSALDGRF